MVTSIEKAKQKLSARDVRCVADHIFRTYGQLSGTQMDGLNHAPTSEGLAHKTQARIENKARTEKDFWRSFDRES